MNHKRIKQTYLSVRSDCCLFTHVAGGPVLTWVGGTLIDVRLAPVSSPSRCTHTVEVIHQVLGREGESERDSGTSWDRVSGHMMWCVCVWVCVCVCVCVYVCVWCACVHVRVHVRVRVRVRVHVRVRVRVCVCT